MQRGSVGGFVEAPADHVDLAVDGECRGVVARLGERGGLAPRSGGRIGHMMGADRFLRLSKWGWGETR